MPPNPMMEALQQSRQQSPAPAMPGPGAAPGAAPQPAPGVDMQKMASAVDEVNAKLDKLLESISGQYRGKEPMPEENYGQESKGE